MDWKRIINIFTHPLTACVIILVFLFGILIYLGTTGNIDKNFTKFGPTNNEETGKPAKFFGIYLDTWGHVILVYIIVFVAALLQTYYGGIVKTSVLEVSQTSIPFSKILTYFLHLVDPFINIILYLIQFYAAATIELQFILPQFVAAYLMNIPFITSNLQNKLFS